MINIVELEECPTFRGNISHPSSVPRGMPDIKPAEPYLASYVY
jgi:hypothetical protein